MNPRRRAREAVLKALKEAGVDIGAVDSIPPSLEDVFVSLIESADREAEKRETGAAP